MMNNRQIDELNTLLEKHAECLTAFYDEGIQTGIKKGFSIGFVITVIGVTVVYGTKKLKSQIKKRQRES